MKEKYGAFNRSYYYFSLKRQNSKFQQQGLIGYSKKELDRKTPTRARWCFLTIYKLGLRSI